MCECGCGTALRSRQTRWASEGCFNKARRAAEKSARAAALPVVSKPCACGCGRTVTSRKPSRRFFSFQCGKNYWNRRPRADREAHRAGKAARHPSTALIHEARAETPKGECIYCPEKTRSPSAFICGSAQCRTDYHRDYTAMRRKLEKAARGRKEVVCRCGCGERFFQERGRAYAPGHWSEARRRKQAARRKSTSTPGPRRHGPGLVFGKRTESRVLAPFSRER
jgi:hypothetical protein